MGEDMSDENRDEAIFGATYDANESRCGGCRFFRNSRIGGNGTCRRHAPIAVVNAIWAAGWETHGQSGSPSWPIVRSYDWCGEWSPRK